MSTAEAHGIFDGVGQANAGPMQYRCRGTQTYQTKSNQCDWQSDVLLTSR